MPKPKRLRFVIMYLLVPIVLWVASSSEEQFRIGVPLVCLGLTIRFWANGYVGHQKVNWTQKQRGDAKVGRLITAGPYAHVRHPLYVGTFFIALGIGVIVGYPVVILIGAAALVIAYRRKIHEEEVTLLDECGDAFLRYKRSVAAWIPRITPYRGGFGVWSWQGILASKEWKTIIWVFVLLIALYLREEIWQEGDVHTRGHQAKLLAYFLVLLALAVTDGIIELRRRRSWRLAQKQT